MNNYYLLQLKYDLFATHNCNKYLFYATDNNSLQLAFVFATIINCFATSNSFCNKAVLLATKLALCNTHLFLQQTFAFATNTCFLQQTLVLCYKHSFPVTANYPLQQTICFYNKPLLLVTFFCNRQLLLETNICFLQQSIVLCNKQLFLQ